MHGNSVLGVTITEYLAGVNLRLAKIYRGNLPTSCDQLLQWRSDQAILRVDKNLYSSVQPLLGAIVR